MNHQYDRSKRKHSSTDEGEWKKISLEGEWEKISLKGEGEWRKINFNQDREPKIKEDKTSMRHETMIPLQDILKSKVQNPVSKSTFNMPNPLLKRALPTPVLLCQVPTPVSLSKMPTPVAMPIVPKTAAISKVQDTVFIWKASTEIRNFLEKEKLSQEAVSEQCAYPVFYSNISCSTESPRIITKPIEFSDCMLYLPDPNDIPIIRQNFPENNILYITGIPTYVSDKTVKLIFEQCGIISNLKFKGKDGCHLEFDSIESARKALKFTGSKIGPKDYNFPRSSSLRRLFIYFDKPIEKNLLDVKSSQPVYEKSHVRNHYFGFNNKRGRYVSRLLKDENRFLEGIPDLIFWLKQGECKKETTTPFLNMIKNLHEIQFRKLNKEFERVKRNYNQAEMPVQQVMDKVSVELDDICKVFNCAKVQNVWSCFSKWQKKNLSLCRLMTLEIRNVHYQERIEKRREEEMDLSDEECDSEKKISSENSSFEHGKKDLNYSFQTNHLENSVDSFSQEQCHSNEINSSKSQFYVADKEDGGTTSSQLQFIGKTLTLLNTKCKEDNVLESTEASVSLNTLVTYSEVEDINSEANKVDSIFNFQKTYNLQTSAKSSSPLQFSEQPVTALNPISCQEDIVESTVTSTAANVVTNSDPKENDSNSITFSENPFIKTIENFPTNSLDNPVNRFQVPFLENIVNCQEESVVESTVESKQAKGFQTKSCDSPVNSSSQVLENVCCQEDTVVESTVTSTVSNKLITETEECDSNGISSSRSYIEGNKGDIASDLFIKNTEIPLIGSGPIVPSNVVTHPSNPSSNCNQSCNNVNVFQSELCLMIQITSYLMICPEGASLESICHYLNNIQPSVETQTVVNVLEKFPNLFREDYSKSNQSCKPNWKFVGLNNK